LIVGGKKMIEPYVCPVCNGQGTVSRPPHITGDVPEWSGASTGMYPCKACNGTGIIMSDLPRKYVVEQSHTDWREGVSDTPRTDAIEHAYPEWGLDVLEHARKLKRELAEARQQIEKMNNDYIESLHDTAAKHEQQLAEKDKQIDKCVKVIASVSYIGLQKEQYMGALQKVKNILEEACREWEGK
jgi:hypothetical protein